MIDDNDLARFEALLTAFAEEQRRTALTQIGKQRITVARVVDKTQIQFERVVDESATGEEIFDAIVPMERAFDRVIARSKLSECYLALDGQLNQIEVTINKRTGDRINFEEKNRVSSAGRRSAVVGLTKAQQETLNSHSQTIRDLFQRIEEIKALAAENLRIMGGEDPFAVALAKIDKRLDSLRGYQADAA